MSDDHDKYRDDVAAYVLGALTEIETAAVDRHLQGCEACTGDLQTFRAVVETLSVAVPSQRAPKQLEQEVLQRIHESEREEPLRPSRRKLFSGLAQRRPALAGACILASVALVAGGYGLGSSVSGESRQELRAAVDRVRAPGVTATLERTSDLGVLRTSNLEPGNDAVYVVWVDRGAGPTFASSFNVGSGGTAEAGVSSLKGVKRMTVTREATPRVARPTPSPILTVQVQ